MVTHTHEAMFKEAYERLNQAQKEAVDTIEGPVMVVAGPGTGKTQILTLRIANILLQTDTKPENILALTFTESGARAMRERLQRYVGSVAYQIPIHTFHSFADTLIREYPDYYDTITGAKALTELARIELIESILLGGEFRALKPTGNPTFYVSAILGQISELKREYITPSHLVDIISKEEQVFSETEKTHQKGAHKGKVRAEYIKRETQLERHRELLTVYQMYESALETDRRYDFDDMISRTVTALSEHEDFLRQVQESYQYVLADEHQDVNGGQNSLLELLAAYHESPNLFVVGDEKQAIYRFQGASLENFLYFEERFPGTKVISLTDNYRSGQQILDAAHSLITADPETTNDLRIALTSQNTEVGSVQHASFTHTTLEHAWIAGEIRQLLKGGMSASEIAVIARTNREVYELARHLKAQNIPAMSTTETDVLTHPVTKQVLTLLRAVCDPADEGNVMRLMHAGYAGVSVADMARIGAANRLDRPLAALLTDEAALTEIGVTTADQILQLLELIETARRTYDSQALSEWLSTLLHDCGLTAYVIEHDPIEGADILRRLYDEVERMVIESPDLTPHDVLNQFAHFEEYGIAISAKPVYHSVDQVSVMTAHKSKGLEFERVFIVHGTDASWGKAKGRSYFTIPITKTAAAGSAEDDERKLLYVAITRAKQGCVITSSDTNQSGREFLPSRFISEIDQSVLETVTVSGSADSTEEVLPGAARGRVVFDPGLLKELFLARGFSVTALNNYRQSPWEYFYRNLLRVPETQPTHLIYGNVMHALMQRILAVYGQNSTLPKTTEIADWLKAELGRQPITTTQYTELHEKGLAALSGYLEAHHDRLPPVSKQEFSIAVSLQTGDPGMPEIPLKGVLDRVDIVDGAFVRVVDYKTGKPKTKGQVEGTTKDSDGAYKRQLVFYKLLLSLVAENEPDMTVPDVYELVFLEPNQKGEYKNYECMVTDEEVAALQIEIVETAQAIVRGDFLESECDETVCHYCDLVALLEAKESAT